MKFSSARLVVMFTCSVFSLTGCIKTPVRTTTRSDIVGHPFPPSRDTAITKSDVTDLAPRNDPSDRARHDRAILQEHAIFFDYDKSDLRPSERDKLRLVKAYLDAH